MRHLFEAIRSEEHTSELQSRVDLVCRLLLEKKKNISPPASSIVSFGTDRTPSFRASTTATLANISGFSFFFFIFTATPEIYTLSLHDALPISRSQASCGRKRLGKRRPRKARLPRRARSESTRLNSSHEWISYAVFCLKKKKGETEGIKEMGVVLTDPEQKVQI